jgi:Tfp pilus assembly protein PilX
MMRVLRRNSRRERGWASAMIVVILLVCASIAAAAVFQNVGARQEAETVICSERAFQAAEAGCDWGTTTLRISKGALPATQVETVVLNPTASFTVRYIGGRANAWDDDGDGATDEADEDNFTILMSTGTAGNARRTLQLVLERVVLHPLFPAAAHLADSTPVLDVNGSAFVVDGRDHFLDGTLDPSAPAKFGLSSPADPAVLAAQIPAKFADQVTGTGGVPSVGSSSTLSIDALATMAKDAATITTIGGTITTATWGTPTPAGVEVVYCSGDIHVSGSLEGAGVLVIEGDLVITGEVTWIGIIVVRGGVKFSGGGSLKRLTGALVCADEISNESLSVAGTVDILYSSAGVMLAGNALATPAPVGWKETGNP